MFFFFSSRRRHTRFKCDWSSDVCSSDLCFFGDVGEGAVMIVVEERGAGRSFLPSHSGGGGTVQEIDVEPAVVVVIEERDAGAGCVEDRGFFGRAGTMVKLVEASLMGDV